MGLCAGTASWTRWVGPGLRDCGGRQSLRPQSPRVKACAPDLNRKAPGAGQAQAQREVPSSGSRQPPSAREAELTARCPSI